MQSVPRVAVGKKFPKFSQSNWRDVKRPHPRPTSPFGGAGMCPSPRNTIPTPGSSETPWKLHVPGKGAGGGTAEGTHVPGKRPEGTEKGALEPDLKEESQNGGRCFLQQGPMAVRGVSLDEGSSQGWYHFQLNPPSPSWLLCGHNRMHKRCFFGAIPTTEQVLGHGKEERGRYPDVGNPCCGVP